MALNYREIGKILSEIRKGGRKDPAAAHAEAMAYLHKQMELVDSEGDLSFLYHSIADQHSLYRFDDEQEKTWAEITKLFPKDPMSWIGASGFYVYASPNLVKAVDLAKTALVVAEEAQSFVVNACNNLCRIAKLQGDYELMEKTIMQLLSYKLPPKALDSAYECDFLEKLPEGAVSELLVRKLRTLCNP